MNVELHLFGHRLLLAIVVVVLPLVLDVVLPLVLDPSLVSIALLSVSSIASNAVVSLVHCIAKNTFDENPKGQF